MNSQIHIQQQSFIGHTTLMSENQVCFWFPRTNILYMAHEKENENYYIIQLMY